MDARTPYRRFTLVLTLLLVLALVSCAQVDSVLTPLPDATPIASVITQGSDSFLSDSGDENTALDGPIDDVDGSQVAVDGHGQPIAARWVDGARVSLSWEELDAFETRLYQCTSPAAVEVLNATLAFYNRGIDMSRFPWYWDELRGYYSDAQIRIMQGARTFRRMPDLLGMEVRKAYDLLLGLRLCGRFYYCYKPDSDAAVGSVTFQDAIPGVSWNSDAGIIITIQGPPELKLEGVYWDPDDKDFDIFAYIAAITPDPNEPVTVPDIVGLTEEEALRDLAEAGLRNVVVDRIDELGRTPGVCYEQWIPPGTVILPTLAFHFRVCLPGSPTREVPNVVGLTEEMALDVIEMSGLETVCVYVVDDAATVDVGCVIRSDPYRQVLTDSGTVTIYIRILPATPSASA